MRKTLWVVVFFLMPVTGNVLADEVPMVEPGEQLVDVGTDLTYSRLDQIERRLKNLERDNRSLSEKLRNLDDTVDDIRRRSR